MSSEVEKLVEKWLHRFDDIVLTDYGDGRKSGYDNCADELRAAIAKDGERERALERQLDAERKEHDLIGSMLFSAGVQTPDGTSTGAVHALIERERKLVEALRESVVVLEALLLWEASAFAPQSKAISRSDARSLITKITKILSLETKCEQDEIAKLKERIAKDGERERKLLEALRAGEFFDVMIAARQAAAYPQAQPKVLCDSTFETNGAAFKCCLEKGHNGAHQTDWRGTEIACAWQAQPKETNENM